MWSPQVAHCSVVLAIKGLEHEDSGTCGLGVDDVDVPTLIGIREPGENGGDDSCGERLDTVATKKTVTFSYL